MVAAYASAGDEPGTAALLDELATWAMVLLPVLSARPDGSRRGPDWAVYDGGERLRSGPRGIPEPSGGTLGPEAVQRADLVVMPGLAGTPGGDRVGTGGGWYDRALAGAAAPRWLLLYEDEVYESLPSDPWDLPVSALVTPSRVIDCG